MPSPGHLNFLSLVVVLLMLLLLLAAPLLLLVLLLLLLLLVQWRQLQHLSLPRQLLRRPARHSSQLRLPEGSCLCRRCAPPALRASSCTSCVLRVCHGSSEALVFPEAPASRAWCPS